MSTQTATQCPDDDVLVRFTEGVLPGPLAAELELHLADCAECRVLVGAAAGDATASGDGDARLTRGGAPVDVVPTPAIGDTVGRYRLLDIIGEGAMGVVFAAKDPELDRAVAVKIVKVASRASQSRRTRMIREARAMAKLSHPNVVPVFDVGECPAGVFIVMELVSGVELRQWWADRTWTELVACFVECGRGLAAAHRAGLMHRDFKPSNVLVGEDGRARVTDFGLAGTLDADTTDASQDDAPAVAEKSPALTRTGEVMGTPAYMSPEQFAGRKLTSASDQFSLCVALAEAVGGRRPTSGRTFRDLARNVGTTAGRVDLGESTAPETLATVLRRGLSVDPGDRYPSMEGLVEALERVLGRTDRRIGRPLWVVGTFALAGIALVLATQPEDDPCVAATERLSSIYDDDQRAALQAAFSATEAPFAADVWRSADARLMRYATELAQATTAACEAAQSDERDDAIVDRRRMCVARAEAALADRLERFERADRAVVEHAVDQLATLPRIARCADVEALTDDLPLPADPKAEARAALLRARLDSLRAEAETGQWRQARDDAASIVEEARQLAYAPLLAESLLALGNVQSRLGDAATAKASWIEAASVAEGVGDEQTAAWAAIRMVQALAVESVDEQAALDWARHGRVWLERSADPYVRAQLDGAIGILHSRFGRYDEAAEYYTRAYEAKRALLGADEPEVARELANLAIALAGQGRLDEASANLVRAAEQLENTLGGNHPDVARVHGNLGGIDSERGDHEASAAAFARALATMERNLGPDHPEVGYYHDSLGAELVASGRFEDGRRHHRRALEILRQTHGDTHPEVAWAWGNLGLAALGHNEPDEALRCFDRLLSIAVELYGDEHEAIGATYANKALALAALGRPEEALEQAELAVQAQRELVGEEDRATAEALVARGRANVAAGRVDAALADYRHALRIFEATGPGDHPDVGSVLTSIADVLLRLERPDDAKLRIDRALAIFAAHDVAPTETAAAKFIAARVRGDGGQRAEARRLAREAHALYQAQGPAFADERDEIVAWLADR